MKLNLLTKVLLSTTLIASITACDIREDLETYPDNLKPVEITGDLDFAFEFNENDSPFVWSLLTDAHNPENTEVFPRDFTYYRIRLNSDGTPWTDPETGEREELYVGPELPQGAVIKSQDVVGLDPEYWTNSLVHPETVEIRRLEIVEAEEWNATHPEEEWVEVPAELFSQGVYQFSYLLDNGSETIIKRNFSVTVNGVEDKVEEISMSSATLSAPVGYAIPLNAAITPANATFKTITWASSNPEYATVDQNGNVTALTAGIDQSVDITATSADGLVTGTTVVSIIEFPTEPVAVDITFNGNGVSKGVVEVGLRDTIQINSLLIPDGLFEADDYPVEWSSADASSVTVSEDGMVVGLVHGEQVTLTAYIPSLELTQTVDLLVVDSPNILLNADANPDFETGELAPWGAFWANPLGLDNLTVSNTAGVPDSWDGFGLHIQSDGSNHTGIVLDKSLTPQDPGKNDGTMWKISFDVKSNNGDRSGWFRMLYEPNGWAQRLDSWFAITTEWTTIEFTKPSKDWSADLARLDLYVNKHADGIDVQIDNIRVEEVK
ncbi:MAG: Ig-like domain-containing protein [Thalassotalea sp.]